MQPISIRKRGQLVPMIAIAVVVLFTLASAGANAIPIHSPTQAELRAAQIHAIVVQRRFRIAELTAAGDRCTPAIAHELARALVFDGRSARAYAQDYEARCGTDPEMERWGYAPVVSRRTVSGS
jgi:hypothetical protein